ncbi:hypothetical protein CRYUN_Cryun24cG0004700 [Craigia yunnanensis]
MALAHYLVAVPVETSKRAKTPVLTSSSSSNEPMSSLALTSSLLSKARNLSIFPRIHRIIHNGNSFTIALIWLTIVIVASCNFDFFYVFVLIVNRKAEPRESEVNLATDAFTHFKHLLLPITDRNPYISEGTRQAAATTAALAKKYEADITVVVIDEKQKEALPEHETQLAGVRWHLSHGRFQEFTLLERLGEGSKPTAIIGEIADDLKLDLVVMSMEAIHSKLVDANLLAEFIPCPALLLPL